MKKIITLIFIVASGIASMQAQNFTAGNIVVLRIGDGVTSLASNTATVPASLLEYQPTGASQAAPQKTVNFPSGASGTRLTISGSTASEGQITLSQNGSYLCALGYDQTTGVVQATHRSGNKTIAVVDNTGAATYSSVAFGAGGATRSVVSVDGSSGFWLKVSNTGIGYKSDLTSTAPTTLTYGTSSSVRSIGIIKNQLYEITASAALTYCTPALPTSGGSATTVFNPNISPMGFVFFDTDPTISWNSTGFDLAYICNFNSGLEKWYFDGTNWVAANTGSSPADIFPNGSSVAGLVGTLIGGKPTLYAISGNGSATSNNNLLVITDNSSRTTTMVLNTNCTATTLASSGTNYVFRGIAFSPATNVVLAAELTEFQAKSNKTSSMLTWSTASEKNNAVFNIEQSTNGVDFQTIGQVKGNGTTNAASNYNFEHLTPAVGVNYYRLKQVDVDGTATYSAVRSVVFGKTGLIVKPTLAQDAINVVVSDEAATTINIINISGQIVLTAKAQGEQRIDVSTLPSGLYIVRNATGDVSRFVKQ